jgi:hypothetical protein
LDNIHKVKEWNMRRSVILATLLLGLFLVPGANADPYEDCNAGCARNDAACKESAEKLVNTIEVEDATAECSRRMAACTQSCTDDDIRGRNGSPAGGDDPEQPNQ